MCLFYLDITLAQFLESAGARVVPLFYDAPLSDLQTQLSQVCIILFRDDFSLHYQRHKLNGALYAGGGVDITTNNTYMAAAELIYNYAIQSNDNGNPFPLWVR